MDRMSLISGKTAVFMLLAMPLLVALTRAEEQLAKGDFYVAASGSDDNPGTIEQPFATLARARDAVRQLKSRPGRMTDVTVVVRGGTYYLKAPLVLGPEDGGGPNFRVVYQAFPGESPILSGGRKIVGWVQGRDKRWTAQVPETKGGKWRFTQLFVNGKRQTRGRMPDTDNLADFGTAGSTQGVRSLVTTGWEHYAKVGNPEDLEVSTTTRANGWDFMTIPVTTIEAVDKKTIIRLAASMSYPNLTDRWVRLENLEWEVKRPGTWSLNTRTGVVTLYPPDGVDPRKSDVIAGALPTLIRAAGRDEPNGLVRRLVIRGLTFTHTARAADWKPQWDSSASAVVLENAEECLVEDCHFVDTEACGVLLRNTARKNRVVGNEFAGCGGAAVYLQGYELGTRDENKLNVIVNNHCHQCCATYWHSPAILAERSGSNIIALNHVHDLPYLGIAVWGSTSESFNEESRRKKAPGYRWDEIGNVPLTKDSIKRFIHARENLLVWNTVHHVMLQLRDGAAIYLWGTDKGNIVRNNLLYSSRGGAVYFDTESVGESAPNVSYDCASPTAMAAIGREPETAEAKKLRALIAAKVKEFQSGKPIEGIVREALK